jgi:hypothetical protein
VSEALTTNGGPKIAAALAKAQLEFPAITKDANNPHFNKKFASLDGIIAAVRPVLASNGIAISQTATPLHEGKTLGITTTLYHASGEWISSSAFVPLAKMDPQGAGSALTYARRYSLAAALCIAAEDDDDGNHASAPARQPKAQPVRAPRPTPTAMSGANSSEIPRWLGLAKDRPMPLGKHKGTSLGDIDTESLKQAEQWCKSHPDAKDLLKDIKTVLTDRALGDGAVEKMKAADAKDDAELPFVNR